jgi:hypothetical protein
MPDSDAASADHHTRHSDSAHDTAAQREAAAATQVALEVRKKAEKEAATATAAEKSGAARARAAELRARARTMPLILRQSLWWYGPIVLVILAGFVAGGWLGFGVAFAGALPEITDATGRLVLQLFGLGMLGACVYCARWWSLDHDAARADPSAEPTALDAFGYATAIVGGGITGVVLYGLARNGMTLLGTTDTHLRLSVSMILGFMGGLFHFKVQELLANLFNQLREKADKDNSGEGADDEKGKSGSTETGATREAANGTT